MESKEIESGLTVKQKRIFGAVTVLILIVFTAFLCIFVGNPMVKFVSEPERFRAWVEESGIWGEIIFVAMVFFQVVVAIIPGEPLEIGAGYAFGAFKGTLLTVIGITLGSIAIYYLVKYIGIRLVEIFFPLEKIKELKFLRDTKKFKFIIFLVFFLPGTPKDLLSYFIGLTDLKVGYWIFLASLVRLPSVITSTLGGSALGEQKYTAAVIVFTVALILSGIGYLIYTYLCRKHNR